MSERRMERLRKRQKERLRKRKIKNNLRMIFEGLTFLAMLTLIFLWVFVIFWLVNCNGGHCRLY